MCFSTDREQLTGSNQVQSTGSIEETSKGIGKGQWENSEMDKLNNDEKIKTYTNPRMIKIAKRTSIRFKHTKYFKVIN